MVGIGLLARRYSDSALHLTTPAGTTANCLIIIALFAIPYTTGAAALFYGASLIVGAFQGLPDCEATALSNLILRRDDQISCPVFTPIDAWEARRLDERAHPPGSRPASRSGSRRTERAGAVKMRRERGLT